MKWFTSAALSLFLFFFFPFQLAQAVDSPFRSLNDLPQAWDGMAGDLFSRLPAQFKFDKGVEVSRSSMGRGFRATYTVQGTFMLGKMKYAVQGAELWVDENYPQRAEIVWKLNDALVPTLYTAVRRVPESSLVEMIEASQRNGNERRFYLKANF